MIENIDKYNALRKQYPTFCYQSFEYDITPEGMKITFLFTIGETITFMPTITIPQREFYKWNGITKEQYDLLVFNIGMIELISYWKATCSPTIVVKPYSLNEEQIKFW